MVELEPAPPERQVDRVADGERLTGLALEDLALLGVDEDLVVADGQPALGHHRAVGVGEAPIRGPEHLEPLLVGVARHELAHRGGRYRADGGEQECAAVHRHDAVEAPHRLVHGNRRQARVHAEGADLGPRDVVRVGAIGAMFGDGCAERRPTAERDDERQREVRGAPLPDLAAGDHDSRPPAHAESETSAEPPDKVGTPLHAVVLTPRPAWTAAFS